MQRQIKNFSLLVSILALAGCVAPRRAQAQAPTYTIPQTVQQTLAQNLTCTGSQQTFNITNLGQTQHYLVVSSISGTVRQFTATIVGLDNLGVGSQISDNLLSVGVVQGTGYYPQVQVQITCTSGGTFSATYSGTSQTPNIFAGSYLIGQTEKLLFNNGAQNANQTNGSQTPFGSSFGAIYFQYLSSAAAGGSLTVNCTTFNSGITTTIFTATLANATTLQVFNVPAFNCVKLLVTYNNNGGGGQIFTDYIFNVPGTYASPGYQYTHITGSTATVVKGTAPAFLHVLTINGANASTGTVSIFDLAAASCTGTPSTNTVAVITTPASANGLPPFVYDVNFLNGICVKASLAMDITVSAQ